ncbi:MAG: lipoate--protein ligase family protein [bacterium]|nr:lipoate--protein ligase family protein [bacterium]
MASEGRASLVCSSWKGPTVVLGYAQPENDVDIDFCRENCIPVLRRISGGTGVIHRRDLSVALSIPAGHPWARGVRVGYQRFLDVLEPVLRKAGANVERIDGAAAGVHERSPICFEDQLSETLVVDGRKAVGCAQARRAGGVLIHAAVLLGLEAQLYARVFQVDETRVRKALSPAVTGTSAKELTRQLAPAFAEALGLDLEEGPAPQPLEEHLALYATTRWAPLSDAGRESSELDCSK